RAIGETPLPGPACIRAAKVAIEINHATGAPRSVLRARRNRQELLHDTVAVIAEQPHGLLIVDLQIVDQATLLLLQALASVVLGRRGIRPGRIGGELRGSESERVLCVGA